MAEINLLDSTIFNRIAAGEVVENPRSVVKELIENSIDAGAKIITIEIKNGGIDYIKITDNGKGILQEDMPLAFLPHATSKLNSIIDLENISTLGFRGEALPSIASVAKVTMISRRENFELGYKIIVQNGKILEQSEVGCAIGTTLIVENLFKNIPAREKFLRKPASEEGDVSELISKYILSQPNISFKYITNEEIYYNSSGNGVEAAIFCVYGNDFLSNFAPINSTMSHMVLSGYVSKPHFTKHNRNYQTLIVNGRYVINTEISYSLQQAYSNFLMKRQFPIYILYLTIPLDMVDVNVHPNKMDVKFVDFTKVKGLIYKEVSKLVFACSLMPNAIEKEFNGKIVESILIMPDAQPTSVPAENTNYSQQNRSYSSTPTFFNNFLSNEFKVAETSKINSIIIENRNRQQVTNQSIGSDTLEQSKNDQQLFYDFDSYKLIGKLFNTYAIVEAENIMYLVDQHAAHEKILFDRLTSEIDSKQLILQDLMLPYVFEVSNTEKPLLEDMLDDLEKIGVIARPLNGLFFSISTIPNCCSSINIKDFTDNLLILINSRKIKLTSDLVEDKLKSMACKAAVKGRDDLSQQELSHLLHIMEKEKSSLFCPHGRPTILKLTQAEIEKWFKRTL